jgi:hypothetical protein
MTTAKTLWMIWCCGWAGVWLVLAGFVNLGHPALAVTEAAFAALSLLAIWAPRWRDNGRHREQPADRL